MGETKKTLSSAWVKWRLPGDVDRIAALHAPDALHARWEVETLVAGVEAARQWWLYLLDGDSDLLKVCSPPECEGEDRQLARFEHLLLITGTIFDWATEQLRKKSASDPRAVTVGLRLPDVDRWLESAPPSEYPGALRAAQLDARIFTINYVYGLVSSLIAPGLAASPLTAHRAVLEDIGFRGIVRLHAVSLDATYPAPRRQLAGQLVHSLLHAYQEGFQRDASAWDREHRPGLYSALRTAELNLLAKRDGAMLDRYGNKHVEKQFEQQLLLLAQSLGFIVVSTDTGKRTVDLVCVDGGEGRATALIEAKTTARPYSFPTDDQRALKEYVSAVERALRTLPPLRLILLVSHAGTKTLPDKLRAFTAETGTPIRFVSASLLASLREALPGPVPIQALMDELLAADVVVPLDVVDRISQGFVEVQEAHKHLVEAMIAARSRLHRV